MNVTAAPTGNQIDLLILALHPMVLYPTRKWVTTLECALTIIWRDVFAVRRRPVHRPEDDDDDTKD